MEKNCKTLSDVILALEWLFIKGYKKMVIVKKQDNTFTIKAKR